MKDGPAGIHGLQIVSSYMVFLHLVSWLVSCWWQVLLLATCVAGSGCCSSTHSPPKWVGLDTIARQLELYVEVDLLRMRSRLDVASRLGPSKLLCCSVAICLAICWSQKKTCNFYPYKTVKSSARRQYWDSVIWFSKLLSTVPSCWVAAIKTSAPQSWQLGNAQCCFWQLETVQENLHDKEDTSTSSASTHIVLSWKDGHFQQHQSNSRWTT